MSNKQEHKCLTKVCQKDIDALGNEGKHLENHIKKCGVGKKRWAVRLMFQDVSAITAEFENKFLNERFCGTETEFIKYLHDKTALGFYIDSFCEDNRELPFE